MINWKSLAEEVGALKDGNETGSNLFAEQAIELIIGKENIREAVDYYIKGGPGAELARFVLWKIHPYSAMEYCYEIYKNDPNIENRRMAVELLRVATDRRVLPWIKEFMNDEDQGVRGWGFGIVDQLLWSELVDEEEVKSLIVIAEQNADENLLENINFVKAFLEARRKRDDLFQRYEDDKA